MTLVSGSWAQGHIVAGTPPPDVDADFRRNHPDFDAPVEKQIEVRPVSRSALVLVRLFVRVVVASRRALS